MANKRKVEIFSAGCPACEETIALVNSIACGSCEIEVRDMKSAEVAQRAKQYGIHRVPAVVIDGELAECYQGLQPTQENLRSAGIGVAL